MHLYILRILMLGTVLFGSTYFFMVMFQCRPVSVFWNENPRTPGKCWNDRVVLIMTYTAAAINCLADWAFGILPIFIVWSLNLPLKSKILAMLILGFAAIGSTATIVRVFYLHHITDSNDFLWSTTDIAIWSTVEPGIGIAAASIATLRPLWQLICYRVGLSDEAPDNLRWRERNRGRRTYIRSEGSGPKRTPRLRPDIDTSLTNITIEASDTLSPKEHFSPMHSAVSSQAGTTKTTEFVAFGSTQPLPPLPPERSWIIKAGTIGAIISRRRVRSNLTNPGLEHSADICLDNGMA
ncbi:integral membrane protein [Diaporthe eres]|nr:integral membrane protein [Diaporthe eres]